MEFVRRILEAARSNFSRVAQVRAYVRDAANVLLCAAFFVRNLCAFSVGHVRFRAGAQSGHDCSEVW